MSTDGRGLDHLMEQNDTELDFLSAYGGVGDAEQADGAALLSALHRFLRAGGMKCDTGVNHDLRCRFGDG